MTILKKNYKKVLFFGGLVAVICIAAVLVRPSYAARTNVDVLRLPTRGSWLSGYVGKNVRITFVSVPTHLKAGLSETSALELVEATDAGIVVAFRPNRTVFFPYYQIASIEPIY